MPNQLANRPAMRAAGHSIRCYASFIVGDVVASGTLSSTPPYPMGGVSPFVNTTYAVGSFNDVEQGMEIVFFDTATGAFKGRSHIRYGGAITALSLPIREYTQAMLNLASGDTFRVYAEWRMHDKLVAALADFPPDMRFYSDADAGDEPEPVVNSGGDWAGFVDGYGTASEAAFATVPMAGSTSFTVYPTGGTVNHDWTLPSGVAFQSGSSASDADPVLEAGAGTHTITHEGEDDASGRARCSHPSLRVHSSADPPHRVLATPYEGTAEDGWNWEIEVVSGAVDFATIPDGCKCILWGRERINGAWQSFRNAAPGRSHILAVGYVARDTSTGSGEDGVHTVTFEVISPLARAKQIKSYSKVMLEDANPDSWAEITELGVVRGILQLTQYYLMLVEAGFDLIIDADVLDERYPTHFLDSNNFYDQIMELAKAIDARLICDRSGRFDLHTHPANIPLDERAAVTVALQLADADILDYEWTREHFPKIARYQVSGIAGGATGNAPVFSLYPGAAPGEALQTQEIARLILDAADPQGDLNARAGRYGALADMVFYDADGIRHVAFDLTLTLRGSYDCFDFYKEYVEVTISDNKRGLDLSGRRFYLLDSRTTYELGTAQTELTLRMETNAATGETYVPEGGTGGGDDTPLPPPPPPVTPTGLGRGTARIALLTEDNYLRKTRTFNRTEAQGGADWDETHDLTALAGWSGGDELTSGVQPAFFTDQLVVAGRDKIYLLDSIATPTATTALYTFPFAWSVGHSDRFIQTERCHPTWKMCLTWDYPNAVMKVSYTIDGSAWATVSVGSTGGGNERACLWMSGRTPGLARLVTFSSAAGLHGDVSLYQTTDYGASWSAVALISSVGRPAVRIDCPYADESTVRLTIPELSGGIYDLKTYEVVGSTVTDISSEITYGGDSYGAQDTLALRTWDLDARRIVLVGTHDNTDVNKVGGIWTSRTGIADMANVIPPAGVNALLYNNAWVGGDGLMLYIAGYGHIYASENFLADGLLDERTGTGIGSARVLNLFGW